MADDNNLETVMQKTVDYYRFFNRNQKAIKTDFARAGKIGSNWFIRAYDADSLESQVRMVTPEAVENYQNNHSETYICLNGPERSKEFFNYCKPIDPRLQKLIEPRLYK